MRAVSFLILFAAFACPAQARKDTPKGAPILQITVKLHHSRQWTRVYHDGKEGWFCATEHNPMYPLMARPKFLELMKEQKEKIGGCKETFSATLKEGKKSVDWSGCRDGSDASAFLEAVGRECGRF